MLKIALISPQKEAYSETFIQAHREHLKDKILYYHTGHIPTFLEETEIIFGLFQPAMIHHIFNKLTRKVSFSKDEYSLLNSLRKFKPDVILAEYGTTAASILPVIRKAGIPMVVHFHGYDASRKEILEKFKYRYLEMFAYATSVIIVSGMMRSKLVELGCPVQKLVQTCCGPNDLFLSNFPFYSRPLLLGVGRFVGKKAPHLTILAFYEVLKIFPDAELRLVGDGPLKPVCEDLVNYLGIAHKVSFPGVLNPVEIRREMENALAFVQHSKRASDGDMEGTPVGILEAQAAALPVVSTYHAGIPEVVTHGETGFLVDENDVMRMSRYMVKLLESPAVAKKMGEAGRARVLQHFTLEKHIATLQKVLSDAAG